MASASNSISTTNNYGGKFTLTASFNETATSTSNNNSTVSISATFQNNSTAAFSGQSKPYLRVYWYDNNSYSSGTLIAEKQVSSISSKGSTSVSGSITVGHKSDGTLNGYAKAIWTKGSGSNSYVPASTEVSTANTALTTIPRKTTITSFGVARRDETSFSFSWAARDTVDYLWYSLNNGSTWTGYDTPDGTSGSFVVNGLSPATTYNCTIKVRRKDSQLTTDPATNFPMTTYSIPTQSLKSKTETSITMNWKLDGNANYLWYSLNNGSTWTGYGNVSSSSGTYTISGLNANQTYNIKTKIRREGTNTTYENGTVNLSVTTHPYPSIVENGVSKTDLKIGQSQTVTLNNPLSRNVTVYMKQNNTSGTTLYSGTTTSTSLTFTPNANTLYNSIPNAKSGNAIYYCTYSNQTVSTKNGTYTIDNSQNQQNPTFSVTNWSYTANLTSLTNNDQMVINNQSTVTFSIDTPAIAKNGASIAKYLLEWGTVNKETTTTEDTVVKGNGNLLKVTAIDSRGYQTTTSLDLGTNFINYINIQSTSSTTEREDGVNANTTLNLRGTMFYDKFGSEGVQNQFTVAKYYVSTDNVNWSTGYNINLSDFTYQNNQYELRDYQIHANGSSGGFTIGTRYYIKVELTDKVSNTTITNILVTDGKLAVDTYQDSNGDYHRGINGLANSNYALTVHGNTFSDGQIIRNEGSSWIQDRNKAVVRNNNTTQGGNYYPVISQKTKDGNWTIGQLSGENNLTFNYTTDTNYNNNNNTSSRCYIPAGTTGNLVDKLRPYPVGSVYISYKATSPASLFGGTWEQLKNHFLFATNATSGDKGGSGNGTGTSTSQNNNNTGSTTLTVEQMPSHTHQAWYFQCNPILQPNNAGGGLALDPQNRWATADARIIATGGGKGHTHTLGNHSHTIPYIEVYVWRRTA